MRMVEKRNVRLLRRPPTNCRMCAAVQVNDLVWLMLLHISMSLPVYVCIHYYYYYYYIRTNNIRSRKKEKRRSIRMNWTTSENRITYTQELKTTRRPCVYHFIRKQSGFVVHTAGGSGWKRPGATPEQKI